MRLARGLVDGRIRNGAIEEDSFVALKGDVFSSPEPSGERFPLESVRLVSPIEPPKMLMILVGFLPADGTPDPPGTKPRLIPKITSFVSGQDATISIPPFVTTRIWFEVEIAAVIGRQLFNASREEASAGILGYTCFNDATAPEFAVKDLATREMLPAPDFFRCKSIDGFASMGPWIDTDITEAELQRGLSLTTHVNGELKVEGNTKTFRFWPSEIVSFVSQQTVLYPGDLISLGTPRACEVGPGDTVSMTVEGVGSLVNHVVHGVS